MPTLTLPSRINRQALDDTAWIEEDEIVDPLDDVDED